MLMIFLTVLLFKVLFPSAGAFPQWDTQLAFRGKSADSIVNGIDALTVIPSLKTWDRSKTLVSTAMPGADGYAYTAVHPNPPQYYISPPNHGQLFQLVNDSYVLYVNVEDNANEFNDPANKAPSLMDTSRRPLQPMPYRLMFSDKQEGLMDGYWTWEGTKLRYYSGKHTNYGLYYECTDINGVKGVYFDLRWVQTPRGCQMITLHSLGRHPSTKTA